MPTPKEAFYLVPGRRHGLSELTAAGNSDTSLFLFKHPVRLRQEDKREEMPRLLQPALCYGNVREKRHNGLGRVAGLDFLNRHCLEIQNSFFLFSFIGRGAIVCLHTPHLNRQ